MKAAIVLNRTRINSELSGHMTSLGFGLQRHGVHCTYYNDYEPLGEDVTFAVCWGWRRGSRIRGEGFKGPILVAERAYLPDRFEWTSLGWDGLNGRARWPVAQDAGERFWRNWGHLACEWERVDGYHLVIGQVLGDSALTMVDFPKWVQETIEGLDRLGQDVYFRPHPEAVKRGQAFPGTGHLTMGGSLSEALAGAACVVTWNSNTGVDAVLAGVPAITMDEGAMALPVSSHSIYEPLVTPDRTEWFRDMAWKQYLLSEIQSGFAWDIVKQAMYPSD